MSVSSLLREQAATRVRKKGPLAADCGGQKVAFRLNNTSGARSTCRPWTSLPPRSAGESAFAITWDSPYSSTYAEWDCIQQVNNRNQKPVCERFKAELERWKAPAPREFNRRNRDWNYRLWGCLKLKEDERALWQRNDERRQCIAVRACSRSQGKGE